MSKLKSYFEACQKNAASQNQAAQLFLLGATKIDKEATMSEVRSIAGFEPEREEGQSEEDYEKAKNNASQKWTNTILKNVRLHLLNKANEKSKTSLTYEEVFSRNRSELGGKVFGEIKEKLPKPTRATKDLSFLNNVDSLVASIEIDLDEENDV